MSQRVVALQPRRHVHLQDGSRGVQLSYQSVGILVGAAEVVAIFLSALVAATTYRLVGNQGVLVIDETIGAGAIASLLHVLLAKMYGLYRLPVLINPGRCLKKALLVGGMVVLALTTLLFLMKAERDFSRGTWLFFAPLMLASCCVIRFSAAGIIKRLLARDAIIGRRAFLVGEAEELMRVNPAYLLQQFGLREVGRLSLDRTRLDSPSVDPVRIADALGLARDAKAKEFIVVAKWDSAERLNAIENGFRVSPLPVRLLPNHVFRSVVHRHGSAESFGVHLIDLQRSPMRLGELAAKRAVDIVLAAVGILLLLPVFLITAVAIKLDTPGPIVFRQRRNGFNQDQFVIYKFRTMTVLEDDEKVVQAKRGDSRITRVGALLRRSSVDELPQLFNVLKGDMALVGPRPHALAHDREYSAIIGDYYRRHHVKPGITGWAQVKGFRGETAHADQMRRRIDLDVWYINNWSLLLDIRILARTCFTLIAHDAY